MTVRVAALMTVLVFGVAACGSEPETPVGSSALPTPATSSAVSAPSSPAAPSSTVVSPVGTVLQQLTGAGRLNVITNGSGFTLVNSSQAGTGDDALDNSAITTYDAAGTQLARIGSGPFTGECGAADLIVGGRRIVLTELITRKSAQGINPAMFALDLNAWDARTGTQLWQTKLIAEQTERLACGAYDGKLDSFSATHNGRWGLYRLVSGNEIVRKAIDLSNGVMTDRPQANATLGDYLASYEVGSSDSKAKIIDPASGSVLSTAPRELNFDTTMTLATGPVFNVSSSGSSANVGLTADGGKLVAYPSGSERDIVVYSLPDLKRLWSYPISNNEYHIVSDNGGLLLVDRRGNRKEEQNLFAFADVDGKLKWQLPSGDVCGMTTSQLMLAVNSQLAIIDLASGKQLSYVDADTSRGDNGCPMILPGGISVVSTSGGVNIVQVLKP